VVGAAVTLLPLFHASAQNPDSGTIHGTDTNAITWTGTHVAPGVVLNKDGSFQRTLTFRGPDLDSATSAVKVRVMQAGAEQ